jgi:hypothetical protein
MLQDDEEDLIIDHTATSTYACRANSHGNVQPCCAAQISLICGDLLMVRLLSHTNNTRTADVMHFI